MPKREDEYRAGDKNDLRYCFKHKRYYKADVGCQQCYLEKQDSLVNNRIAQHVEKPRLQVCPSCKQESLFWNNRAQLYECLNERKCGRRFKKEELIKTETGTQSAVPRKQIYEKLPVKTKTIKTIGRKLSDKITSARKFILQLITKLLKPSWRKKKVLKELWRILPKIFILVFVVAIAALITSCIFQFITSELKITPVIVLSLAGLVVVLWGLTSMSKYRVSFTRFFILTLISVIFVLVSSTYLGIRSFEDIKDNIMGAMATEPEEFRSTVDLIVQRAELKVVSLAEALKESVEEIPTIINNPISEASNVDTMYVRVSGGVLVGADGGTIKLYNNTNSTDPSWEQLKNFLLKDETDRQRYDYNTFVCADFAEMLHNNAEKSGFRTAYVCVQLGPCAFYSNGGGHALNAFQTTDRGLVSIDCTNSIQAYGINADKVVDVKVDMDYIPYSIFPEPGWSSVWGNMGVVKEIEIIQW